MRCKWCGQEWAAGDGEPWCRAFVCPKRLCEADDAEPSSAPGRTLLSEMDAAYLDFERRVLLEGRHRTCPFGSHARTCFEEAFRAGWLTAETCLDRVGRMAP